MRTRSSAPRHFHDAATFNLGLGLILDGLENLLETDLSNKRMERTAETLE